ncbi:uncharacterized protein [Pyrus communis]|uniref:uncharacterized protein n=1 Tax=Pyrus communis TaxID=23211 RepID=UPI0035BFEA7C
MDAQLLADCLGMERVDYHDCCLGLPVFVGQSKKETFAYIKDRLWKKLNGWPGSLLSNAGKEILVKTIAQAIPLYTMQTFLLPKSFCEDLNKMVAQFWWGRKAGMRWNTNLIRNWFMEEESSLILSIPLSLFNPADSIIWTKESKGVFTTKSDYFVARTCHGLGGDEPIGSALNEETKFLWKALWRAKVPGKVKICVWRRYMNALPTKVNLKNRRVLTEDICGLCDKESETVEHALLQCPRSAAIWFGSPMGIRMFQRIGEGFGGWLINMAKTVTKDSFELLFVLVWNVWKVEGDALMVVAAI